jgi:hypothetical protein
MRASLSGVRRRVERLVVDANLRECGGHHSRSKLSHVYLNEPVPEWPEAARGERCSCGHELEFTHVVHSYPVARADVEAFLNPPEGRRDDLGTVADPGASAGAGCRGLAVADTGDLRTGMVSGFGGTKVLDDRETAEQAFEPTRTTRGPDAWMA